LTFDQGKREKKKKKRVREEHFFIAPCCRGVKKKKKKYGYGRKGAGWLGAGRRLSVRLYIAQYSIDDQ
jgi:hypothetical protein